MRKINKNRIKNTKPSSPIVNLVTSNYIANNCTGNNGIAVNMLFVIITLFVAYSNAYAQESIGVTTGKEILKDINKNSGKNTNLSPDIKTYQKQPDQEVMEWTMDLEKKLKEDVKSQEQVVMPDIQATEEDIRIAEEIVEKSQVIIHESLGISQGNIIQNKAYTDFLIFASFSMGEKNLKKLTMQAARYNGVVVLRGFKNGDLKETTQFLLQHADNYKSTDKQGDSVGGITIDPNLFKEYSVTKVPTYVLTKPCEDNMSGISGNVCKPEYDKLTGNVSPRYALEKFSTSGEFTSAAKERLGR